MSLLLRMLRALSPTGLIERRNVAALARQLRIGRRDAEWIVRRSRQVGYPQARTEFEAYARRPRVAPEQRDQLVDAEPPARQEVPSLAGLPSGTPGGGPDERAS